jgi:hypothetical protein
MDPISFVAAFALGREPGPAPAPAPPAPVSAPRPGSAVGPAPDDPPGARHVPIRPEFGPVGDAPRPPLHDPDPDPAPPQPAPPVERVGVVSRPPAPAAPGGGPSPRRSGAGPTLWRLADATGQEWTHPDRRALERWVAGRNAALAAARVPSYSLPAYGGACANGRCPR